MMRQRQRNKKHNQQELLLARRQAQQAVLELHELLPSGGGPDRQRVGRTLSLAAQMGLLNNPK